MTKIDLKYLQLGGEQGFLGQATDQERICPDGEGHFRHYQGGSVYWHPDTGAHEVHGAIRAKWSQMGWETGFLGYPASDELPTPDGQGRFSLFQYGALYWNRRDGCTLNVRSMPTSVAAANEDRARRKKNLISSWVMNFVAEENMAELFPAWNERGGARDSVRRMAAVLTVLGCESEYPEAVKRDLFHKIGKVYRHFFPRGRETSPLSRFQKIIEKYSAQEIGPKGKSSEIGTTRKMDGGAEAGDYDMVLVELATFLYAFCDKRSEDGSHLLTNEMIYRIVYQSGSHGGAPFTFTINEPHNKANGRKRLVSSRTLKRWWQPETENHMLMIYTWNFLISNWLMWQATLPDYHFRYDKRVKQILLSKNLTGWMRQSYDEWHDLIMQLVGRVVHNGLFETNARPYQGHTVNALLALATYAVAANPPLAGTDVIPSGTNMPDFMRDRQRVWLGAKNALYYLAVKFAFQSFEGKRSPPMRRSDEKKHAAGFYQDDCQAHIFGILSGAYVFNDWINVESSSLTDEQKEDLCPYYYKGVTKFGGFSLWAALSDFELPHAIHDFMLNKHGGYFARMQAKYFRDHYERGALRSDGFDAPRYFNAAGQPDMVGGFRGTPELYFATDDYLISAGGLHKRFYRTPLLNYEEELDNYHFWSKPTMIITKGDIGGQWWRKNGSDKAVDLKVMERSVLHMLGKSKAFSESQNVWVYKNFAYGYEYENHKRTDEHYWEDGMRYDIDSYCKRWPQRFPAWWRQYGVKVPGTGSAEFEIGAATFIVLDFRNNGSHPMHGNYLIMAKMYKIRTDGERRHHPKHRDFRRGLVEVVPSWMFSSPDLLIRQIKSMHKKSDFNRDDTDKPYYYVMATTLEKLRLHPKIGVEEDCPCDKCPQGIEEIVKRDSQGSFSINVPVERYLFNARDADDLKSVPLITVWGIGRVWDLGDNAEFAKTDAKYVETLESGKIAIRNPFVRIGPHAQTSGHVVIDSSSYRNPRFATLD